MKELFEKIISLTYKRIEIEQLLENDKPFDLVGFWVKDGDLEYLVNVLGIKYLGDYNYSFDSFIIDVVWSNEEEDYVKNDFMKVFNDFMLPITNLKQGYTLINDKEVEFKN